MPKNSAEINRTFWSFLVKLLLLTFFTAAGLLVILYLFPSLPLPSKTLEVFLVIFGVTTGVHYILLRAGRGEATQFANFIILSVVIKLFLYAVFTFLLIVSDRQGAMANVVLFFALYIIFTVFEITIMYRHINRPNA